MQRRDSSRSNSHRRPRLLRACTSEPSPILTASLVSHSPLGATSPGNSTMSGRPNAYRRATDLLNHVAYLSACNTSPTSSPPMLQRMSSLSKRLSPPSINTLAASDAVGVSHGHGGRGAAVAVKTRSSSTNGACTPGRRSSEDVFGSSPASTNTGTSLDDEPQSPSHPDSANYFSFPSFDTWDPDSQDNDDDEDSKIP